jgi:hypothetical protein
VLRSLARRLLRSRGYEVYNTRLPNVFSEDGLTTYHNHTFIEQQAFIKAYARAVRANGSDHHIRWRAHVAMWAARQAASLPGVFVECGVSTGFLASAIMDYLGWNSLDRSFYLFDTWHGLDQKLMSEGEIKAGRTSWFKNLDFDSIRANFHEYRNVSMIRGSVPESLRRVSIDSVCYLSLDMNCTQPEIAAAEYFWPKMVPGGIMLLDDYAYSGYEEQHFAFNEFAERHGFLILTLPTGQGLAVKN